MSTIQDKFGRDIDVAQTESGWAYSAQGVTVSWPHRNDARAIEQFSMVDVPAATQEAAPVDPLRVAAEIEDQLDAELDSIARSWGYKNSNRLATYANSTNPAWKAEADVFIAGRDEWWKTAAGLQAAWKPGNEVPTYEAVRALMPEIKRP